MFPYKLRKPVFGRTPISELSKGGLSGGGAVQQAIEYDLKEMLACFHRSYQTHSNDDNSSAPNNARTPPSHQTTGSSFKIFGDIYRVQRVAKLHAFLPPKCDPQAFAQLIYGACLSILQHAQTLDEAAGVLFLLYSLKETSPFEKDSEPSELLPLRLHCLENPRYLYRRVYDLPIRIDRKCYMTFMIWKEEAACKVNECNASYWEYLHHKQLEGTTGAISTRPNWTCSCGIASDFLHVFERLKDNLNFCEYTGPGSLEGLAGHPEYLARHHESIGITDASALPIPNELQNGALGDGGVNETHPAEALLGEVPQPVSTDDIAAMVTDCRNSMGNYNSVLRKVRLPSRREQTNTVARVRRCLEIVFQKYDSQNDDTRQMLGLANEDDQSASSSPSSSSATKHPSAIDPESAPAPPAAPLPQAESTDDRSDASLAEEEGGVTISLPASLSQLSAKILKGAIKDIVIRHDQLGMFEEQETKNGKVAHKPETENVPNHSEREPTERDVGLRALHALLAADASVHGLKPKRPVGKKKKKETASTTENLPVMLLHGGDSASSASDLSSDSWSDENEDSHIAAGQTYGDDDDESVSVATSAAGDFALRMLLSQAGNNKKNSRPAARKRRTRSAVAVADHDDAISVATSAAGDKALRNLLSRAAKTNDDAPVTRSKKRKDVAAVIDHNDNISVATSAAGDKALRMLLSQADHNNNNARPAARKRRTRSAVAVADRDDGMSVATSAAGDKALRNLLSRAAMTNDDAPANRSKKRMNVAAVVNNHDDNISVATSAAGDKSLRNLLSQPSNNKKNARPPARKRRTVSTSAVGDHDDTTSVATSAAGDEASRNLLSQAANANGDAPAKRSRKRKHVAAVIEHDDTISVATSAAGDKALRNLLSQAADTNNNSPALRSKKLGLAGKQNMGAAEDEETTPVAASAVGDKALHSLLSQSQTSEKRRIRHQVAPRRSQRVRKPKLLAGDDESSSIAASAAGDNHASLQTLDEDNINDRAEDASVATSAAGGDALQRLLSEVKTYAKQPTRKARTRNSKKKPKSAEKFDSSRSIVNDSTVSDAIFDGFLKDPHIENENTVNSDVDETDQISAASSAYRKRALKALLRASKPKK